MGNRGAGRRGGKKTPRPPFVRDGKRLTGLLGKGGKGGGKIPWVQERGKRGIQKNKKEVRQTFGKLKRWG